MLLLKIFCILFIFLNIKIKVAKSAENQENISCDLKKLLQANGVQNFELNIKTKFKEEIIKTRESLVELIKNEFKEQRNELENLLNNVKEQKRDLSRIKDEIYEQNETLKNVIRIEFSKAQQLIQENTEKLLKETFRNGFLKQSQEFSAMLSQNFQNYKQFQDQLFANATKIFKKTEPVDNLIRWDEHFTCIKDCGPIIDLPGSCHDAVTSNNKKDGIYLIKIKNSDLKPFFVYCKTIDKEIWTVFQRREDGSVDFNTDWKHYRNGFGNLNGEYWLGLERLNAMTKQHKHELHIWIEKFDGKAAFAHYGEFAIASESEKYKLKVGNYSGNATDCLITDNFSNHNGMAFSTRDNCNDNTTESQHSCALTYGGGWWFNACYRSNLNGNYTSTRDEGVDWNTYERKLKYAQMSLRRK